ncbi:hypothetical protein ABPG74_010513 [Tetrahymena malaccensis]
MSRSSQRSIVRDQFQDQEEEDNDDSLGEKEIERLNNLWLNMKQEKKQMNLSTSSMNFKDKGRQKLNYNLSQEREDQWHPEQTADYQKKAYQQSQKDEEQHNGDEFLSPEFDPAFMEQKLQESYNLLTKAQEKNSTLVKKLAEAEDELDKCHQKIAKISQIEQMKNSQLSNAKYQEQYTVNLLQGDLDEKDKLIKQLRLSLEEYQEKCNLLLAENNMIKEKNANLSQELDNKISENNRIKSKLGEVEKIIDEMILEKNSKGVVMLEIDYLKNDIEKLLQLLGQTAEFKDFFKFAKDSRDITNLKYIPKLANVKQDIDDKVIKVPINQKMLWVPRDAFSFALHLKQKYNGKLDEKCIEEFLFGYNKIFSDREEKQMERYKKIYTTQITSLKLQLEKKTSYKQATSQVKKQSSTIRKNTNSVVSKSNVNIEKQLDDLTRVTEQNKENQLFLTDAIKLQEEYEKQLQEKQIQIEELNLKVQELQVQGMKYDKLNYMEGSVWMLDKILKEVLRFRENIIQMTKQINNNAFKNQNQKEILQNYKWFVDNVEMNGEQLIEKINYMKESTLKSITNVKKQQGNDLQESFHQFEQQQQYQNQKQQEYSKNNQQNEYSNFNNHPYLNEMDCQRTLQSQSPQYYQNYTSTYRNERDFHDNPQTQFNY